MTDARKLRCDTQEELEAIAACGTSIQDQMNQAICETWINQMTDMNRGAFNSFLTCVDKEVCQDFLVQFSKSGYWTSFVMDCVTAGLRGALLGKIDADPDTILDAVKKSIKEQEGEQE